MGSDGVVVDPPGFDEGASLRQRSEHMLVEAFVAQPAVKGFHKSVLHRLAGCDVVPFDADLLAPPQDRHGGQLGAIAHWEDGIAAG